MTDDAEGIGHNSGVDRVVAGELRQFIERIENLAEEKQELADDIKEVYAEAKGRGYDTKIMRKIVAIRKRDADERREEAAIMEIYCNALGLEIFS